MVYFLLSLVVFAKTVSYALYEYNKNKNKPAGIAIITISIISIIVSNVYIFYRL
jgi:hypothetical protein